jgi:hypothetical protein
MPPKTCNVSSETLSCPSRRREVWPQEVAAAKNAGVMVVGRSAKHGGAAAVLLGGRFHPRRGVYAYSDFGGGVERAESKQPQVGAFREFVEELLGEEAGANATLLWDAAKPALLGGAPIVHKSYAMFLVPAEALVQGLQSLPCWEVLQRRLVHCTKRDTSAIDQLLAIGKRNSELKSLALVSISEVLGAVNSDSQVVAPLCVRSLDGARRDDRSITLRHCLGGSLAASFDRLESYARSSDGHAAPALSPEKAFMKDAKAIKDILKIERQAANGTLVKANQIKNLDKKDEVLANLRQLEQHLPSESDVRVTCKDVIALLFTDVVVPSQKYESSKEGEHASMVAAIHAFKQTPSIACAKIEPLLAGDDKEEAHVAHEVDYGADVADVASRGKSEDVIQIARAQ